MSHLLSKGLPPLVFLCCLATSSCSGRGCPDIGCVPQVSVVFDVPVSGAYTIKATVFDNTYGPLNCPGTSVGTAKSGISCDSSGILIQGQELFRGSHPSEQIVVQIDEFAHVGAAIDSPQSVLTNLTGSANGDGCEMNCYRAQGTFVTEP